MVRWSDQAKADLKAIHNYIARDSAHYAKQVTRDIVDKVDALVELPRLGRIVEELGENNVREIAVYSYRILYEIMPGDDIVVLTAVHKRRDLSTDGV